ncbi:RNA-binding protein [Streptomyces sp. DH12]|uniref:RNA recognition motif domain-containing protein n=1 Tax=Streptomyces sp. DH12 TaxID=2857010 RepID=UPI001E28C76E|nr:RNA-binding protein [Streptomyces sp. DH12]
MNKAYVGALHYLTTSSTLKDHFAQYNPTEAIVMTDGTTGASRGFGMVTFDTEADLEAAITALNDSELDGRKITVKRSTDERPLGTGVSSRASGRGGRGTR